MDSSDITNTGTDSIANDGVTSDDDFAMPRMVYRTPLGRTSQRIYNGQEIPAAYQQSETRQETPADGHEPEQINTPRRPVRNSAVRAISIINDALDSEEEETPGFESERSEHARNEFIEAGTPTVLFRQNEHAEVNVNENQISNENLTGTNRNENHTEEGVLLNRNMDWVNDLDEETQTALTIVLTAIPEEEDNIKIMKLSRGNILKDVMKYYEDDTILSKKLSVEFLGESGADLGGLTKDMFSSFWKEAFVEFFKGEDAVVPFLPIHRRLEAATVFPLLGKILSHMLMLVGDLPPKLCRSSLWSTLCTEFEVTDELRFDDFLLYVSHSERIALKEAVSGAPFSEQVQDCLSDIFRCYGMHVLPNMENVKVQILNIARSELLDKPYSLCMLLKKGVSSFCIEHFFSKLDAKQVTAFYNTLLPTPIKVVKCFQAGDLRPEEDRSLFYLKNYVREMNQECLEAFLLFVTGSSLMPLSGIKISFNSSSGLGRAPVAHTCGNVLDLPVSYSTYQEFKREWNVILSNNDSFKMSIL